MNSRSSRWLAAHGAVHETEAPPALTTALGGPAERDDETILSRDPRFPYFVFHLPLHLLVDLVTGLKFAKSLVKKLPHPRQ